MFGRKKKKANLDWQPESDMDQRDDPIASAPSLDRAHVSASSDLAHTESLHQGHTHHDQSDVWNGLIHPKSMLRFFRRRLPTIITVVMLTVLAGLAIFLVLPAKYATKALILVDPRQPNVTNSENLLSGIGGDAAALTSYVQIMNSDGFLSKVVDELGVKDDPDFAEAENKTELIGMFQGNMSANRQGATYIVEVYYKSKNKETAAKYANGIANAFIRDQKEFRSETSAEATRWLSERLTLLQSNLKKSEDAVAAYQARNGIVDAGSLGTLDNQQLASMVSQLAAAETDLAEARARYTQASQDGVPASSDTSQNGQFNNLNQLMQEQNRLRRQSAELNQTLGSRHPRVLANVEQQRTISGQIAQERRRLVQRSKQAFRTAEAKKQSLERQLADARQRAIQLNKATVELGNLERQATANRNLYEQFLARYKITDEQSQFQFSEARIVSPAPVPIKSTSPSIKLVVPVLLVLGFGLGVLLALIKEAFAAQTPEERHAANRASMQRTSVTTETEHAGKAGHLDVPAEHYLNVPQFLSAQEANPTPQTPQTEQIDEAPRVEALTVNDEMEEPPLGEADVEADVDAEAEPANEPVTEDTLDPDVEILQAVETSERKAVRRRPGRSRKKKPNPIVFALSERDNMAANDDAHLETLMDEHHAKLDQFINPKIKDDAIALLVTAAQTGDGRELTTNLVRDYAIEAEFHPVVISLQEQARRTRKTARSGGQPKAQRVARLQEFEEFDVIPFVSANSISDGQGLADNVANELSGLIALCKENYGFVLLETSQILDPDALQDLIDLADSSLMVLDVSQLEESDLADWQDWALAADVGLVLDQTQN